MPIGGQCAQPWAGSSRPFVIPGVTASHGARGAGQHHCGLSAYLARTRHDSGHESRVDAAVQRLYSRPGPIRIEELAGELGMTTRQLQRLFPRAAGGTPKEFQRLARFRSVVRPLLLNGSGDYLPAALGAGETAP